MGEPATAAVRLLSGEREPVRVATTGPISLQGLQTVDGVALFVNDRVLVKDQLDARDNGIWTASTGRWFRASDANFPRAIGEGVTVQSQEGAANGGKAWRFDNTVTRIGADPIQIAFYLSANFAADAEDVITAQKASLGAFVADQTATLTTFVTTTSTAFTSFITAQSNSFTSFLTASINAAKTEVSAIAMQVISPLVVAAQSARDIAAGYASDAFTKGEVQVVATVQGLSGMTIGAGVTALRFNGYAAVGDNGGWPLAVEVANTGDLKAWQRQSNGGARRWELRALQLTLEMFGGKADGTYSGINLVGTDNSPAFQTAQDYISVNPESIYLAGPTIQLGYGSYACYSTLKVKKNIRIIGAGGAAQGNANLATQLLFAQNVVGLWLMSNGSVDPATGIATPSPSTGTSLENFTLRSAGGADRSAHAIRAQTRFVARGMRLQSFAGNGYHIQGSVEVSSNVNTWEINGGRVTGCQNGIYTQGGDANAGAAYHVDTSSNRQCGILDNSFLGNYYFGCHENGNGTLSKVRYNGVLYFAAQSGALFTDPSPLSTTPPGTNPAVWEPLSISDGGGFPTWVSGGEYYPSGQKVALNVNGRSVFIGGYSEGGYTPSLIGHPSALFGGFNASGVSGTGFIMSNNDLRGAKRLSGEVLEALLSGQADFEGLRVWNNTAGSRFVRTGLYVGTIDNDGINRRGAGRFSAIGYDNGNSELTWDYWNFAGKAFAKAFGFTPARALVPGTDNVSALGSASLRWSQLFAANATINTSDERTKQQIEDIPDEWLDAWAEVQWCRFKFNDAVEVKGEEGARWHTGLIAQRVADVFVEHGIDPYSLGLVCYDEWDEEREPVFAQEPVLNEQGEETGEMREVDTGEMRVVREAGNLYGIRYEEAFAIEAAYQRRRAERVEARLLGIEERLSAIA